MFKKSIISIITFVFCITLAFGVSGCDNDNTDSGNEPNIAGGATSIPAELGGKWFHVSRFDDENDPLEIPNFTFTENKLILLEFSVTQTEFLVRVTDKKIEYTSPDYNFGDFGGAVWCESYTISDGILTFTNGVFGSADDGKYKQI